VSKELNVVKGCESTEILNILLTAGAVMVELFGQFRGRVVFFLLF
jgi:hypothetical protein